MTCLYDKLMPVGGKYFMITMPKLIWSNLSFFKLKRGGNLFERIYFHIQERK